LRVGDLLVIRDGGARPIVATHQETVNCVTHPRPDSVWPVRVRAGALGSNAPRRDLYVSPDHAVLVDGVLVPARLLVNGTSITRAPCRQVTYHHVELTRHEIIFAEGLAVESYLGAWRATNMPAPDDAVTSWPAREVRP